jgi:HlyD family secretion protein
MTISDLSKMQVRARVDEVDVPLVQPGQKARVYLQSDQDKPVPAKIIRVASKGIKPTGRDVVTFEAIMEVLSQEARIKPGMTANVEIEVDKRQDAITIPVEAIVHRMRKDLPESAVKEFDRLQAGVDLSDRVRQAQYIKVVYVMENDVAKVRVVDPGIADSRRVEMRVGVELDDTVIIGPYRSLDQLKDGKRVALAEKDKKKPEGAAKPEDESKTAAKDKKEDEEKKDSKDEPQTSTASAKP